MFLLSVLSQVSFIFHSHCRGIVFARPAGRLLPAGLALRSGAGAVVLPGGLPVSQRERGSNARQHRRIRRLRPVMLPSCLSASFTPSTTLILPLVRVLKTLKISDIRRNFYKYSRWRVWGFPSQAGFLWETLAHICLL